MNVYTTLLDNKPLRWIGSLIGLLLVLITIAAIYVATRSDEWWREQVTTTLSQSLGREVEIKGTFKLQLGSRITARMDSLRISNPGWLKSKDMLTLGSLLFEFDALSVLGNTFIIHRLELTDVDLALEENKNGKKNWLFTTDTELSSDTSDNSPSTLKSDSNFSLPVKIEHLALQNVKLSVLQSHWQQAVVLKIDAITAEQSSNDEVALNGKGELGKLPYTFKANFSSLAHAIKNGPVSFQLNANLGKASLRGEGSVDLFAGPLRPKLELVLNGPDIKKITQAMGASTIAEGPFKVSINMVPNARGVESKVRAKVGTLKLNADISVEDLRSFDNIDVTTQLSGNKLAVITELFGLPTLPKGAFNFNVRVKKDKRTTHIEKVTANIGKHQLSFDGVVGAWPKLKNTRLTLAAQGPDLAAFSPLIKSLGMGQMPAGAYNVNAKIEPGKTGLRVLDTTIIAGDYEATAEGNIFTNKAIHAELNVTGKGPDLSMISRLVDTVQLPAWPFEANGKIKITQRDITLSGAKGTAGKHQVAADGKIAFSAKGPLKLKVEAQGPSLQPVLQGLGYDVIPASAAYKVEGTIGLAKNSLVVGMRKGQLGETTATATLNIEDLNTPTSIHIDINNLKTNDISDAIAQTGIKQKFSRIMPASVSGKINFSKGSIAVSKLQGSVGTANIKLDGTVGEPPLYDDMRVNVDISGKNLEHFLPKPIKQTIPFLVKGKVSRDNGFTNFDNVRLQLANIRGEVHGKLGNLKKIEGTELTVTANAPNLDVLASILNQPLPKGAVKLDGHIVGKNDAFHINRLYAQLGPSNISGDLKLIPAERPLLTGKLSSTHLVYKIADKKSKAKNILQENTQNVQHTDEFDANEEEEQQKYQLLFPDTPIQLSGFNYMDLDLDIYIKELASLTSQGLLRDIKSHLQLKDRKLHLSNFEMSGASGANLKGNLKIEQDKKVIRIDIDITGEKIRLGLGAAPEQTPDTYSPIDIEAKISGTGSTYRKLFASLQGRIKLVMGGGRVSNSRVVSILSDTFFELFYTLNPFAKSEATTRLNCGVGIIYLQNKKAIIRAAVMQTDKIMIVGGGSIDLNSERLDIGFNTRPRRGLGLSVSSITNPYIKLGGYLSKPAIELSPEGATIATGAAVATSGLSFLFKGLWDRFFTSRDPCGEALKNDAEQQAKEIKK